METEKTEVKTMKATFEEEWTDKEMQDLLIGAFEGGSNYWYFMDKVIRPKGMTKETLPYYKVPFVSGGGIIICDIEESEEPDHETWILNRPAIENGLKLMVNHTYSSGELHHAAKCVRHKEWHVADAEVSDIFLQLCLFGETIYG